MPLPNKKPAVDSFAEFADAPQTDSFAEFADADPIAKTPPASRSLTDTAISAAKNFPKSAIRFAKDAVTGMAQIAGNPVQFSKDLGEVLTGAYARYLPQEWIKRPDLAAEWIAKADAAGGMYKDRYGSIEALKNTIATDPAAFLGDVSAVAGIGAATLPGRVGSTLATASRVTDPLRITGILPAAEVAGKLASRVGGVLARGPKTNVLMEATEGRAPEVINALRNQPEIVRGSMPTAGEAAAPTGVTRYAALQENARAQLPTEYFAREKAQNAARVAALRQVGQDAPALDAAKAARATEARMLYGAAGVQPITINATAQGLLKRPSMQKAIKRARKLAEEDGVTWGANNAYTAADAHYVKIALDDLIKDPATFGIGKVEASKIGNTQKEFIRWLETQVPDYGTARSAFRARSAPINQMEVGQYLESKLTSALQGDANLRPVVFAGAVQDAPRTIKQATTGASRFENLSDVLTPSQIDIIKDVQRDLERLASYRDQAQAARVAGPQAAKAGTEQVQKVAGGVSIPNPLETAVTVANAILKRLAGKIDRKLAIEIATEMLDPQAAAVALEKAQRTATNVAAGQDIARTAGRGAARAATPAAVVTNAMGEENRNSLRQ
jgi:hypothetical protein